MTEILNNFHIGIAAPIITSYLRDYLVLDPAVDLPKGMGGSPSTALALELLKRGRKVSIFSLDPDIEAPQKFAGENLTIYFGKFRKRGRDRIKDGYGCEREFVAHAVREASPDIVNAHWTYEYALGALSANTPVLVTAHDAPLNIFRHNFNLFKFNRSVYWLTKLLMAFKVIKKTIYMTTVSPYVAEHLRKRFSYKKLIKVIPNGVEDSRFFEVDCDKKKTRESFVFVSAANGWTKLKNEKILLHAFSVVNNKYPFTELWMFGIGHEPDGAANAWAEEESVSKGVRFIGEIPHKEFLEKLLTNTDVLVHPSLEESFGNVFIEAMSVGIPTIGGKFSGGVPSTLGFGKAGLLVDVKSENELAKAMVKLIEDKTFREKLGADGKEYAYQNYRISKIVDQYEEEYARVLQVCK